jgi:hypothetical protein
MTKISEEQYKFIMLLKNDELVENLIKHDPTNISTGDNADVRNSLLIEMLKQYFIGNEDYIVNMTNMYVDKNTVCVIFSICHNNCTKSHIMNIIIKCEPCDNTYIKPLNAISNDIDKNISVIY